MKYVIGIDGGGTKTKGVILGEDKQVYAASECESTNYQTLGIETAVSRLKELIYLLLQKSNINESYIVNISCCLSGIDSDHDQQLMENHLTEMIGRHSNHLAANINVYNDGIAALYSVDGSGNGAIVVAGTGCVAFGKDAKGTVYRIGGWGHVIGDLGSGFDIGRRAVISVVGAAEGIAASTLLTSLILEHVGAKDESELIAWSNHRDRSPRDFASLVPIVTLCAQRLDTVSLQILRDTAIELGKLANYLFNKGTWVTKRLSIVGGLSGLWDLIKEPLMQTVNVTHSDVAWLKPRYSPVMGAAFVALHIFKRG